MEIILSGGGSGMNSLEIDKLFASLVNKSKPLLYIPIAIDKIKHPYSECLQWLKQTFNYFGIKLYEIWSEEQLYQSKIIGPENFGGIYIGGGNTFYLLKVLKESNFWNFLVKAVKKNIPIYGGSAGAIIFGRSILTSYDENLVGLKDFSGMNLLKNMSLFCHFKLEKEGNINEKLKNFHLGKIIALSERTGVYLKDDKIMIIGQEPAYLFSNKNKKKINVGQII